MYNEFNAVGIGNNGHLRQFIIQIMSSVLVSAIRSYPSGK